MDNPTLTRKLKAMAKHASIADNDEFIDGCTGASGRCCGMTATEFHRTMIDAMKYRGN
jgi:hypothetical protein